MVLEEIDSRAHQYCLQAVLGARFEKLASQMTESKTIAKYL